MCIAKPSDYGYMYTVTERKRVCNEVNFKFQEQCTLHTITNDSAENKRRDSDDEPIFSQLVSVCIDDAHSEKEDEEIVCQEGQ